MQSFLFSRCFSISCRTANIAFVVPLPGMKPNCSSPIVVSSLSLLSMILSQLFIVCDISFIPGNYHNILYVSLLFKNRYNHTISPLRWYFLLLIILYPLHQLPQHVNPFFSQQHFFLAKLTSKLAYLCMELVLL